MKHIKYLTWLSYDGTEYRGFQLQPAPTRTVQLVVERALCRFLKVDRDLLGCQAASRTDSGVHARQQYVEFRSPRELSASKFVYCVNELLPDDVAVHSLERVDNEDFNVRYARAKVYSYDLHIDPQKDCFLSRYRKVHLTKDPLDVSLMRSVCGMFEGDHDFRLLSACDPGSGSTIRRVFAVRVVDIDRGIRIIVYGRGFLHKMVRNIVGVLIAVGEGRLSPEDVTTLLRADDEAVRERRIKTRYKVVEGKGLCLQRVFLERRDNYDESGDTKDDEFRDEAIGDKGDDVLPIPSSCLGDLIHEINF